jgi:regulator of RNase E activity RraB
VAPSEAEFEKIIEAHEARNNALLQIFVDRRVDLTELRLIECHFWASNEKESTGLAHDLTRLGFAVTALQEVKFSNDPDLWYIEFAIQQSIELMMRREFTDELAHAAARHSGKFDGWGTTLSYERCSSVIEGFWRWRSSH